MPHVKHPVSNPAHGCALQLHLIGFVLCSKSELKTEQEVRFLNKLLELKIGPGCPIFKQYLDGVCDIVLSGRNTYKILDFSGGGGGYYGRKLSDKTIPF